MTLLNDLLEEAITRAGQLAEESVEAGQEAASLVQAAHDLKEQTQRHAQEMHQRYDALERQLAEARSERAEIGTEVSASLEKARDMAGEVEQHVADLLDSAHKSLESMQEQRERLRERFAERILETQERVGRLVGQLEELEATAGNGLDQVRDARRRLGQQVWETRMHLSQQGEDWVQTAHDLRSGVNAALTRLAERHVRVLSLHAARLDNLKERLALEHNKAVAALLDALTARSLDEMGSRLQPVFDAAERVPEGWRAAEESMLDGQQRLGQRLERVADTLDGAEDAAAGIARELS